MDQVGRYRPGCRSHPYRWRCIVCARPFEATRCTASFCSPKCRKRASRRYAAIWEETKAKQEGEALAKAQTPPAKPQSEKTASQNAPGSQKSRGHGGLATGKTGSAAVKPKREKPKAKKR
jgi:hypothetical protein